MAEGRQAAWLRIDSIDAAWSKARSPRPFDAGLAAEAIAGLSCGQIELRSSTRGAGIKTAASFGETPQTESLGPPVQGGPPSFEVPRGRERGQERSDDSAGNQAPVGREENANPRGALPETCALGSPIVRPRGTDGKDLSLLRVRVTPSSNDSPKPGSQSAKIGDRGFSIPVVGTTVSSPNRSSRSSYATATSRARSRRLRRG